MFSLFCYYISLLLNLLFLNSYNYKNKNFIKILQSHFVEK